MRLDDIIRKYRQIKITQAIVENSSNAELNSLLNEVDANLNILIQDRTSDPFGACLIFSEMALRKIGSIAPICAYYYATLAQSQTTIPASSKVDAIRMRLFSVFSNLDIFERFIMMAHSAPMMGYNGSLNDEEFFDFIIMGDTYRVWDSDEDSAMLKSIKKLAISHQGNHPHFSRMDVIKEGEKAHEALLTAVKYALHKMD